MESWTVFCAFRGLGAVTIQRGTSSGGGMFQDSGWGCSTPHFAISLPGSHLAVVDRPASDDTAGTSRTIATPHLLPLVRHAWGGSCYRPCYMACAPLWGSLSSYLSLREGFGQDPDHKPQAGAKLAAGKPHEMALSDPDLWRACLLRLGFPLAAFSHARRATAARFTALPHSQLLHLGCPLVLRLRQPPQSSSEGCFLSRSGGSGLRMWEAI